VAAPDESEDVDSTPSKSARKRAASAAQRLGERLIALTDAELASLELPEVLRDAVSEARRIGSRSAQARQRQYIGRLMRKLDSSAIEAALTARDAARASEARRFQRLEHWRARLIADGPAALDELARAHPEIVRGEWQRRIAAAAAESARHGSAGAASRELFRALRALLAGEAL